MITTYNRSSALGRALEALAEIQLPEGVSCELLVVDNNSTDNTRVVVEQFISSSPIPVRYIFEELQGSSFAKNHGLRESLGDIIVLTDDDCIPDPRWIISNWKEFSADPSLDMLGGRVELYDKRDYPISIQTFKERIPITSMSQLSLIPGCNMAFRRHVHELIGGYDYRFGPGQRFSGDDKDFIYRAFRMGLKIVYTPDALVYHNHGRRTDEQVSGLERQYVLGRGAFYCKHILGGDREVLKHAYWEVIKLFKEASQKKISFESKGQAGKFLRYLFWGAMLFLRYRRSGSQPRRTTRGV